MTADDILLFVGLLLGTLALALWPLPADVEPTTPGSIDYRPAVLQARRSGSGF